MNGFKSKKLIAADKDYMPDDNMKDNGKLLLMRYKQLVRKHEKFKDAYDELMPLLSIVSHYYNSGIRQINDGSKHDGTYVLYIDMPAGQCYWSLKKDYLDLFEHLPEYDGEWCGERDVNIERLNASAIYEQNYEED